MARKTRRLQRKIFLKTLVTAIIITQLSLSCGPGLTVCQPLENPITKNFSITISFIDKVTGEAIPYVVFELSKYDYKFEAKKQNPCRGFAVFIKSDYNTVQTDAFGNYIFETGEFTFDDKSDEIQLNIRSKSGGFYSDYIRDTKIISTSPTTIHYYAYFINRDYLYN